MKETMERSGGEGEGNFKRYYCTVILDYYNKNIITSFL